MTIPVSSYVETVESFTGELMRNFLKTDVPFEDSIFVPRHNHKYGQTVPFSSVHTVALGQRFS